MILELLGLGRRVYPELFNIGPFTVYTYGVLLAASYLLGLRLAMSRAKKWGVNPSRMLDLGIYIIIAALVGAKLLLLVVDFDQFSSPRDLLNLARLGGVFYGGLILAVVVAFWYMARHQMPFWTTCDVFAPGIALGPRDRTARVPCRGLLLRQADRRAVGRRLLESTGGGERRHAAGHSAASDAAVRSGRGARHRCPAAGHGTARAATSPAARSGPTCSCMPSRGSSIEIYRGDPRGTVFGTCRRRSSSPCSLRRSAWPCCSGCRDTRRSHPSRFRSAGDAAA